MDFGDALKKSYWIIGIFTIIFLFFSFFSLYTNIPIIVLFSALFRFIGKHTISAPEPCTMGGKPGTVCRLWLWKGFAAPARRA